MGGIYLVQGKELVEMIETPFEKEDLLQKLLADFPRVLGGDQLDGTAPRQWLLVTREAGIPDTEGGSDRWSIDHLFVDEDGTPTFVEVKRSSDTRTRREVVGQMLDYVSHAKNAWPDGRIRALFEGGSGLEDAGRILVDTFGADVDADQFWTNVDSKLREGRIRLVFVVDKFPTELLRIVEFLSEQMSPAEVLGIEVRQYIGQGLQTLVPRVIRSKTPRAQSTRGSRWDYGRFLEVLRGSSPTVAPIAERLYTFAEEVSEKTILWGTGTDSGSFTAKLRVGREIFSLFSVYTTALFTMNIGWNADRLKKLGLPDFDSAYRERFSALIGRDLTPEAWRGYGGKTELSLLSDDVAEQRFESLVRDLANGLKEAIPRAEADSGV